MSLDVDYESQTRYMLCECISNIASEHYLTPFWDVIGGALDKMMPIDQGGRLEFALGLKSFAKTFESLKPSLKLLLMLDSCFGRSLWRHVLIHASGESLL